VIYDTLAPIYDRMMSHVAYDEWADLIDRVAEKFLEPRTASVFELGGGTGVLASLLKRRGFRYFGSDRSFHMCKVAGERRIPFVCADALAIPCKKTFDLIVFLYDGINYLPSLEEYARLFSEVARCLAPGGLFLFDITTEANSLNHFRSYLEFDDWGDYAYVRRSYYRRDQLEQHNDITVFRQTAEGAGLYEKHIERHCQKVFGAATVARAVPSAIFETLGVWDNFSFRRYGPHSERVHFLLKKAGP
jgi:SAM-dependent methyltransferase